MNNPNELKKLSDTELLRRLAALVSQSRRVEADLVAHIGEVDARQLYRREACPSMFVYCRERLHLSEAEAYMRIGVARAARLHPVLLDVLRDGRIHLVGLQRLVPHLSRGNRDELIRRATHKSRREIEVLVAGLAPKPDVQAAIRKAPEPRQLCPDTVSTAFPQPARPPNPLVITGSAAVSPSPGGPPLHPRPAVVAPLAPERYFVKFTASAELCGKLERLQALMRSSVPDGGLAAIIEQAVTEKLERLEARRFAQVKKPRKSIEGTDTSAKSRYIPAPIRRAVHERDGGRCRYADAQGRRCTETANLEFHHVDPFGRGGDHRPEGLRLLCKLCRGRHKRHYAERRIMPLVGVAHVVTA